MPATDKPSRAAASTCVTAIEFHHLMLGHSDIKTTQRCLNITDEELRKALTGVWERRRQLKVVGEDASNDAT